MKNNYNRLKTASRLKNWIACNYTTVNEINKKDLKKKDQSTTEIIRKKRGDEFEAKIYQKLIKQYPKYIKIKNDDDKIQKTKEAIKKGYDLINLVVTTKLLNSKSEVRRSIKDNGIKINDIPVKENDYQISIDDFKNSQKVFKLSHGKKNHVIIKLIN